MHLHGHLQECVKDFGPVYSFWCFAFERMNGILGSYHTNNHNISIQLAQRFLDKNVYASYNWPQEFVTEYYPLLQKYECYSKGSLKQSSGISEVITLPPVHEHGFLGWQIEELHKLVTPLVTTDKYHVLVLHNRANAVLVGDSLFAADGSRHSNSCFVLALHASGEYRLAKILYFAECIFSVENGRNGTKWVAFVSWFEPHQCKVWFGFPTQVWCTTSIQMSFILLQHIKCHVAYTKATVNFGRFIGEDVVFIITPVK